MPNNIPPTYPDIPGFRPGEGFEEEENLYSDTHWLKRKIKSIYNTIMSIGHVHIIQRILSQIPVYPAQKRRTNIRKINIRQRADIKNHEGVDISIDSTIIRKVLSHADSRKLVFYYRWNQTNVRSDQQIREVMRFLRMYIEWGYSSVFDTVGVVYRRNWQVLDIPDFKDISYKVKDDRFRALSSIYANTVHFTDGTPDIYPGTIPIISETVCRRWKQDVYNDNAVRILDNSISYNLIYDHPEHGEYGTSANNPDYESQCRIILSAVQECERHMLEYGGVDTEKIRK